MSYFLSIDCQDWKHHKKRTRTQKNRKKERKKDCKNEQRKEPKKERNKDEDEIVDFYGSMVLKTRHPIILLTSKLNK